MKKLFVTALWALITLHILGTPNLDSLASQASRAERINNADLYYNLGVDYYAAGEQGLANLYYLKALNLNSAHRAARANLDLSLRLSQDYKLYPQRLFLVRALFQGMDFLSVNRLAYISLLLLILSAACFVWLLYYNPDKERALPILSLIFFTLLCLIAFISLGTKSYAQRHNQQAVLISQSAKLLAPEAENTTPVMELHAGMIVTILETKDGYSTVRLPNGQTGRLNQAVLRRVVDTTTAR